MMSIAVSLSRLAAPCRTTLTLFCSAGLVGEDGYPRSSPLKPTRITLTTKKRKVEESSEESEDEPIKDLASSESDSD